MRLINFACRGDMKFAYCLAVVLLAASCGRTDKTNEKRVQTFNALRVVLTER